VIAQFGGRYLVRGARAQVIEAEWPVEEPPPQTVIVAEFPSMKALEDWYASPEYGVRVSRGRSQTTNDLCRRYRRAAAVAGHITVRPGSVDT
jgi:uncharacterized protein (DUF1330 family)